MMTKQHFPWASSLIAFLLLLVPVAVLADDDGEDNGDVIIVEYIEHGQSQNRAPMLIPFDAMFFATLHTVELVFAYNIGEVSIRLTNMVSNNYLTTIVDSSAGSTIIPVTLGTGLYRIEFCTEDGVEYEGYFSN